MKKKLKKIYIGLIIGAITSVFVSLFTTYFFQDLFNKFENFTYDMRYKWEYDPQISTADTLLNWQPNEDVIVCDIDERAMSKYGVYHKWPRSYHGDVVKELTKNGAAVVGFDILFGKADFGVDRTKEIEKIVNSVGVSVNNDLHEKIRTQVNYDKMFADDVAKAKNVISAMQMNDSSEYQFGGDWKEKSTEQWRLAIHPDASSAKLPDSISRAFYVEHPVAGGKTVLREKDALEGIFPYLAQSAQRVGFVNVVPDPDGVQRKIPLFYNFRGYTYPAISLQMAMYLTGVTIKDIEIKLGEYINLGKPFSIWKDSTSMLKTSYPTVTGGMIERLIEFRDQVKNLSENKSITISPYLKAYRDENNKMWLSVISGEIPQDVFSDILALPVENLKEVKIEETTQIGQFTGIKLYSDNTFDIIQINEKGEQQDSWEGLSLSIFNMLHSIPVSKISGLKPNESIIISSDLSITKNRGIYKSQCPFLKGKTIEELITLTPADLKNLTPNKKLKFGEEIKIPIDKVGNNLITFRGPARKAFKYLSYYDVKENRIGAHYFQHKAVILGSSAPALFDIVTSPFSGRFPGVEIHATLLSDFLDNIFMKKLDPNKSLLILLGLGILMGVLSYLLRPVWSAVLGVVFILGYFLFAMSIFDKNLCIEIVKPIMSIVLSFIAVVAYKYVTEEKDKKFLHETFKQYLTPALIDQMYESKRMPSLGGEEGVRTAYFTDIQGFSTFSEKLGSPTKLVELLNEYLTAMTDTLLKEEGTLDKYEGDAIIAFFGAPMPLPDHATRACGTAIKMQKNLATLRQKWQSEGEKWPKIVHEMRMRVGINSGPIVTGNMGSTVRMNYTMMGDAVNLAARLESGSKMYGAFIMCSDDSLKMTDGSIIARQLDIMRVMGKSEPVSVHEVLCFKNEMDEKTAKLVEVFAKAYQAYLETRWDDAIALFEEAVKYEMYYGEPGVKTCPSIVMKERCLEYKKNPPVPTGQKWDGVYTATSK